MGKSGDRFNSSLHGPSNNFTWTNQFMNPRDSLTKTDHSSHAHQSSPGYLIKFLVGASCSLRRDLDSFSGKSVNLAVLERCRVYLNHRPAEMAKPYNASVFLYHFTAGCLVTALLRKLIRY